MDLILREKLRREILKSIDDLPSLPTIVLKIKELLRSSVSSAKEFEEIIKKDQVISGRVLKLVNSAFFSLNREVTSIREAIVYLGISTVTNLVLSASVDPIFEREIKSYGYSERGLWLHANGVAYFSYRLGQLLGLDQSQIDTLYTAGLLHDVGKVPISSILDEHGISIPESSEITDAEDELVSLNHQKVGEMIFKKWGLPHELTLISLRHHKEFCEDDILCGIVTIVDAIMNEKKIGLINPYPEDLSKKIKRLKNVFSFPTHSLEKLCSEIEEKITEIEKF